MKKILHIAVTVVTMLVVSRFIVRIIDATVQIDDDIGLVLLLVAAADAVIGLISARLYRHLSV
ncbi:MAG: hypothetical protein IJI33_07130 [Solobacterium sp.]|nr:hypothetical protein [Solobacterium sp.]MBQ6356314.1 hypothetical protein [Solobacterium sp.]MBQ6532760.1 hypothetical protein [Solobacterium sp.]MBR0213167.1 hypothetical protein [Solobacterium sp.]